MLPCCDAAVLRCCRAAMLPCCDAAVLRCCRAAMLPAERPDGRLLESAKQKIGGCAEKSKNDYCTQFHFSAAAARAVGVSRGSAR
jgi:hypothetical protein